MKLLFFILLVVFNLFASNIKSHNIYVREDRVDIMLSFDTPFDNPVQQQKGEDFIRVILIGVSIDKGVEETIDNPFVKQMSIIPYDAKTEVLLKTHQGVNIIASKTVDGFGLRLRIKGKNESEDKLSNIKENIKKEIKTKEEIDYSRYYLVVGVLFLLLIVLLVIKKMVERNRLKGRGGINNSKEPNLSILYQKIIDDKNRLMLFEFEEIEYLVMVGNSNILLNKKELKKKPKTKQEEFEEMLKEKGVDLNNANIKIRN